QQINQMLSEKNNIQNQLQATQQKLEEEKSKNSSLNNYIEKLQKAKNDVEDTANKAQQIVNEHTIQ
ncbi:TPA: DNA-directed RNA polymerase subunit omega, partial [Enterococcus faecium]|nr:DNA-directed RNA polymerase subunit omega [Enterococcus faecium]HCD6490808.1 DNA-directed RNA polymerase subunit omega [Enterococcus faecium]HCD8936241.1 DNA-directed RNA polymerase subunit omega [Enterococcus faecium]